MKNQVDAKMKVLDDRFELIELLGEGRIGRVYRAKDQLEVRQVAVKVPHDWHSRNPEFGARFRRELLTGMRLNHPSVVCGLETGEHEGVPFLVSELIEGQNIISWFNNTGRVFEDLASILEDLLDALDYAHSQRVVHQELKPANILITKDKKIKLLDFGLAGRLEDQLKIGPKPDQALAYLAPEQCMGERGDERSDLYSLGAILFHVLADRPPFEARNLADYLLCHLNENVPHLSTIRGDIPVWLERLVAKLLARRPDQRPETASEVLNWVRRRRSSGLHPAPKRGGPMWGRAAEVKELEEALSGLEEGHGTSVRLSGAAGIGKTRLLEELQSMCRERGFLCVRVSSTAESTLHLGHFSNHFDDPELPLFERIIENASALPLVLVVEGCHRAHSTVSELLVELSALVDEVPLLVVTTDRPDEHQDPKVRSHLDSLEKQIVLKGLDWDSCAHLIEERIWAPPPKAATGWFMQVTEGNPLFIKLMAEVMEGSHLTATGGEARWSPPPPHSYPTSLEALLAKKLEKQGPEPTTILGLGACLGERFTFNALKAVTYHDELELEAILEQLVREGILKEEWSSGLVRYRFHNSSLWSLARESVQDRRRRRLHLLAARFYEKSGIWPASILAYHFAAAEKVGPALKYAALSAEESLARRDLGEAIFYFAQLLKLAKAFPEWPGPDLDQFRPDLLPGKNRLRTLISWALLSTDPPSDFESRVAQEKGSEAALMQGELFLWDQIPFQRAEAALLKAEKNTKNEHNKDRIFKMLTKIRTKAGQGTLVSSA